MMPGANRSWINNASRTRALEHLASNHVEVLVVGGGITGAGIALDAARRGMSVALIESHDFASGTSGYSSKLIHGGLRYLAKGDFPVAWESAVERRWLMESIAPHLIRPLGFVIPDAKIAPRLEGALAGFGTLIYDGLRRATGLSSRILPRPQLLSPAAVHALAPGVAAKSVRRGWLYWDGQVVDDARLVLGVLRTAASLGAHVIRDLRVTEMTETSMRGLDTRTGETLDFKARVVINATGIWAHDFANNLSMTPSRGTHLVVRSAAVGNPHAAHTVAAPGHFGRYVFVLPQPGGRTYIGLTDEEDRTADGHHPSVPETDITFLLETVNRTLSVPLSPEDVVGSFAGLRPLVHTNHQNGNDGSADISRRHLLRDNPGEPITVAGGKLTTYRKMAEEAVDAAAKRIGNTTPCSTKHLPLVGAASRAALGRINAPKPLVEAYGTEAAALVQLGNTNPLLQEPLFAGSEITGAHIYFGVLAEGANSVEDLLQRRTRLAFVPEDAHKAHSRMSEIFELAKADEA
ncbi:FAD-dependent oxidoreductase [Arthrobacter sp. MYb227]|uniref:glycerol-3-phosphate dehydrogenase/oxidase n=1 Tax=Arthrobacter sp. MYb227 TaxID=1848601 RepID=UPI000CFDB59E|nr:glycerol-3-phosphate dehydrogenase/oxidase [Arthrobacter sp. MYb227]PQZ92323.1 FAD-dependent oxidoreductase [Arthrobacter sp. MYb227]